MAGIAGAFQLFQIREVKRDAEKFLLKMEIQLNKVQSASEGVAKRLEEAEKLTDQLKREINDVRKEMESDFERIVQKIYLSNQGITDFKSGKFGWCD